MRATQRRLIPNHYQGSALPGGRGRRWRWPTIGAIAIVVIVGTVLALSMETAELLAESNWLKVRGVQVGGHRQLDLHEIQAWLGAVEGQPILDVDPTRLAEQLAAHPRIAAAQVTRGFDRRLHVEIEERRAIALVLAGVLAEIDRTGLVLPPIEGEALPDLPVVTGITDLPLVPGERLVYAGLEGVIHLLEALAEERPTWHARLAEIDLHEDPVLRVRLTGTDVVLRTHIESISPERLDGLQAVLDDLDRRGRRHVEIDLRFEGQMVVRPTSPPGSPAGQEGGE